MSTCFQKGKSRLITFRSGKTETMIDYILVNKNRRSSVKDVKVIQVKSTESAFLLLMDVVFRKKVRKKVKFRKKLEVERVI